jgi:hypothetical protein
MTGYIYERTIPIPISKTIISTEKSKELSLKNNLIDPSKMSPPDNFMEKLMQRMDNYYSPTDAKKTFFNK